MRRIVIIATAVLALVALSANCFASENPQPSNVTAGVTSAASAANPVSNPAARTQAPPALPPSGPAAVGRSAAPVPSAPKVAPPLKALPNQKAKLGATNGPAASPTTHHSTRGPSAVKRVIANGRRVAVTPARGWRPEGWMRRQAAGRWGGAGWRGCRGLARSR